MRKLILPTFIAVLLLTGPANAAEASKPSAGDSRIDLGDLPLPKAKNKAKSQANANANDNTNLANLEQDAPELSLLTGPNNDESSVSGLIITGAGNPLPETGLTRPPFHLRTKSNAPIGIDYLTPEIVTHFYGISAMQNNQQGAGQTIAIIDAYHNPNIADDLNVFSQQWGLPLCNAANPCFKQAYASGKQPAADKGWSVEIALDVEWAHAIAPRANILLVEADSNSLDDLFKAVDYAVKNGANVVSMSFGGAEFQTENFYDFHFDVPNVIFTASSGDNGDGVEYPAASPYVIAVGGTSINTDPTGAYLGETGWSGSGGGLSAFETAQAFQQKFTGEDAQNMRGVPDVAYGADPQVGYYIYDSFNAPGWIRIGGTSAGAPQWAALIAIGNSMRNAAAATLQDGSAVQAANIMLYHAALNLSAYPSYYHDITSGGNGACGFVCTAESGYDYVTGLGSPIANKLLGYLSGN
jgi:subtilase family serine protease